MKCEKCGSEMQIISQSETMEIEDENLDDMTEGQMADYMAAELSGDLAEWGTPVTVTAYRCESCGHATATKSPSIKDD